MLKHLKRVLVSFAPGDPKATAARELLQRLSGDRAKKSNPQCKVEFKVDEDTAPGHPYVELHFNDNEQRKIMMAEVGVADVARLIDRKGDEMELKAVFKDVGFDPWNAANRLAAAAAASQGEQQKQASKATR